MEGIYIIYKNLEKFFKYRGDLKYTDLEIKNERDLIDTFESEKYLLFNPCIDKNNNKFFLILLDPTITETSSDVRDIVRKIKGSIKYGIVIYNDALFSLNTELFLIDILLYSIDTFRYVIPEQIQVPKHEIIVKEEIDNLINFNLIDCRGLPKIQQKDPAIVWIGGRTGDIIKITRPSRTSCYSIAYRIVY